jgi:RimJ/RimL family protein N-acetyltransferase
MPTAHEPIQTARLTLRPFTPGDLDDMLAYMSRPDVVRYLYTDAHERAESERLLQRWVAASSLPAAGERLVLAVTARAGGRVMGELMLKWLSREHRQAELGYAFHPDFHGQGYAREAAAAMLELGFQEYGFHRIIANCDARNTASYKLMERLGMRREAHFIQNEFIKGEWTDELVYAILQPEWARLAAEGYYETRSGG